MSTIRTKVNLDELPEVLLERVNSQIDDGFRVLDIEKTVTTSTRTEKTYVDFNVKLNKGAVFIEYRLDIYPHRNSVTEDVRHSVISSFDILFYITQNDELFSRVSELVITKTYG